MFYFVWWRPKFNSFNFKLFFLAFICQSPRSNKLKSAASPESSSMSAASYCHHTIRDKSVWCLERSTGDRCVLERRWEWHPNQNISLAVTQATNAITGTFCMYVYRHLGSVMSVGSALEAPYFYQQTNLFVDRSLERRPAWHKIMKPSSLFLFGVILVSYFSCQTGSINPHQIPHLFRNLSSCLTFFSGEVMRLNN